MEGISWAIFEKTCQKIRRRNSEHAMTLPACLGVSDSATLSWERIVVPYTAGQGLKHPAKEDSGVIRKATFAERGIAVKT